MLFQTICRQLRSSKGFSVESAALVAFSTSSYSCGRKKKVNPYEEVDQEKYSNLVQSVLSSRGVAHTPGSVEEDALLCGPVSKHKPPKQGEDRRVPQNWFPIFNPERSDKPNASDPSVPLKIPLQRNVIPSVTRVLQQTMTKQQVFWLERWKQRMILELGEDGFKEYNSILAILPVPSWEYWRCMEVFLVHFIYEDLKAFHFYYFEWISRLDATCSKYSWIIFYFYKLNHVECSEP